MKKGKGIILQIHLTNRWLYVLIVLGVLALLGVGVYALLPGEVPNPGHSINEVGPPSACSPNQYLKFDGTNWVCATETDPTVRSWAKMDNANIPNMNSYFIRELQGPWSPQGLGISLLYVDTVSGGSYPDTRTFDIYKPTMLTFDVVGPPDGVGYAYVETYTAGGWHEVKTISDSNGVPLTYSSVMLMPGRYRIRVSGPSGTGGWIGPYGVYGQNNNILSTVWTVY